MLGSGSTQVREAYAKPVPPPHVPEPSLNLPRNIIMQVIEGDKGAAMQLRDIAGPDLQTTSRPRSSGPSMSLEYTASHLESTRATLEVVSKHVRDYMVTQGEWVECPPSGHNHSSGIVKEPGCPDHRDHRRSPQRSLNTRVTSRGHQLTACSRSGRPISNNSEPSSPR